MVYFLEEIVESYVQMQSREEGHERSVGPI